MSRTGVTPPPRHLARVVRWPRLAWAFAYVIAYCFLDWVSYIQPPLNLGITAWNPQAGLTVVFLIIQGWPSAVWTVLGALLSEIVIHRNPAPLPFLIAASAWIAVVYGAQAWWLRRLEITESITTPAQALKLMTASCISTMVVAAGYVVILASAGVLPKTQAAKFLGVYFVGDWNGTLATAPLLLTLIEWTKSAHEILRRRVEFLGQIALAVLFGGALSDLLTIQEQAFFFLLFIPVVWATLRTGMSGALITVFVIQLSLAGYVRFHQLHTPFVDLQCLVLTLSGVTLVLSTTVAERNRVLGRLISGEAEQRQLLAVAPEPVLVVTTAGRVRVFNNAAKNVFGELGGDRSLETLLPTLTMTDPEGTIEIDAQSVDGGRFPAQVTWTRLSPPASPGFLLIVRDLTQQRLTESQFRAQQKTLGEAINHATAGEVATAVAHDINQPLTALTAYLQAAQIISTQPAGAGQLATVITKSLAEAHRASMSLRRLQDLYHTGSTELAEMDVRTLCLRAEAGIRPRLRDSTTECVVAIPERMPPIRGVSMHLEIALHNLVSNALDAVEATPGPRRLRLTAQVTDTLMLIRVEDSGSGVPPNMAIPIFEPNVTTKPHGMGLGLALSRSLLRAQGGDVALEPTSNLGGACFVISLPLAHEPS